MTQKLPDLFECPELYPLYVKEEGRKLWVLQEASSDYFVGEFDGDKFETLQPKRKLDLGPNYYAAQNFNGAFEGKQIQIAWMRGGSFPHAEFNQQMSFPCELRLEKDEVGYVVCRRFMLDLVGKTRTEIEGADVLAGWKGEPFHLEMEGPFPGGFAINVNGESFALEGNCLRHGDGAIDLTPTKQIRKIEILIDVASLEFLFNDGRAGASFSLKPTPGQSRLAIHAPDSRRTAITRFR